MNRDFPSRIQEKLYLGNLQHANNHRVLGRLKITHVLSVCSTRPQPHQGVTYLVIPVRDDPKVNIATYFARGIRFIRMALENGGVVLVHCVAGVSRSATMTIAYLMHTTGVSYPEAVGAVRRQRPVINPNLGFVRQLQDYSAYLQTKL